MNGEHPLIILLMTGVGVGEEEGVDDFFGSFEDDGGVEGEEAPSQGSVVFGAGDPCLAFEGVGCGAGGCFVPFFALDGEVEFGWVDVVVAF